MYTPDLLLTGRTDTAVLLLPERLVGGTLGDLLTALVTAGAFAAFLSTSSGLTVSVAGVLSQDMLRGSVRDFRLAAAVSVAVPFVLSLGRLLARGRRHRGARVRGRGVVVLPAARARHLVARADRAGATAGLLTGGGLATAAVAATIAGVDRGRLGRGAARAAGRLDGAGRVRRDGAGVAPHPAPGGAGVARTMVRLHAPEAVALAPAHPTRQP